MHLVFALDITSGTTYISNLHPDEDAGLLLSILSHSILLTHPLICRSHLLVNVNTPTQLANQVFSPQVPQMP